jgi:hypothetical protein
VFLEGFGSDYHVKGSNRAAYLGLRGLHVNIGDKAHSYKTQLVVGLT